MAGKFKRGQTVSRILVPGERVRSVVLDVWSVDRKWLEDRDVKNLQSSYVYQLQDLEGPEEGRSCQVLEPWLLPSD